MSALTCDICGGNLAMNESGEFAICESCGMKHTKERVKVKVQEIKGVVEVTKGEVEKERLLKNAETFVALKQIVKAEEIFLQLTNEYPDDYRGWMGLLKCQCCYSCTLTSFETNREYIESKYQEWFSNICNTATTIQKLNNNIDQEIILHINLFLEKILEHPQYTYAYVEIFKSGFEALGEFKKYFLDQYKKVMAFDKIRSDFEALDKLQFQIYNDVYQKSKIIYNNSFYRHDKNYSGRIIECLFYFENHIGFHIHETAWEPEAIVYFETNQNLESIIDDKIQEEQQKTLFQRKNDNVCLYCGSSFNGLFKKVCSKCGKPKDY